MQPRPDKTSFGATTQSLLAWRDMPPRLHTALILAAFVLPALPAADARAISITVVPTETGEPWNSRSDFVGPVEDEIAKHEGWAVVSLVDAWSGSWGTGLEAQRRRARRLQDEANAAFRELELRLAKEHAQEAIKHLDEHPALQDDRASFAKLLRFMGAVDYLLRDQRAAARHWREALLLEPDGKLVPWLFNPPMRKRYAELKHQLATLELVRVAVTCDAGCGEIYDGDRSLGVAPLTLGLKPGRHHLRAERAGYETWRGVVEVKPRRDNDWKLALVPKGAKTLAAFREALRSDVEQGSPISQTAIDLGERLAVQQLLILAPDAGEAGTVTLKARLYGPRWGSLLGQAETKLRGRTPSKSEAQGLLAMLFNSPPAICLAHGGTVRKPPFARLVKHRGDSSDACLSDQRCRAESFAACPTAALVIARENGETTDLVLWGSSSPTPLLATTLSGDLADAGNTTTFHGYATAAWEQEQLRKLSAPRPKIAESAASPDNGPMLTHEDVPPRAMNSWVWLSVGAPLLIAGSVVAILQSAVLQDASSTGDAKERAQWLGPTALGVGLVGAGLAGYGIYQLLQDEQ